MNLNEKITATGYFESQKGVRLPCDFEVLQYCDGSLHIECTCADQWADFTSMPDCSDGTAKVIGRTSEGHDVASGSHLRMFPPHGTSVRFVTNEITVRSGAAAGQVQNHSYLLTNVMFPGAGNSTPDPVEIQVSTSNTPLMLVPSERYLQCNQDIKRHKQPTPTATLRFTSSSGLADVDEFVQDVCTALSIVQGHKVNWITHEVADSTGKVQCRRLHERVTKRSSGLPLDMQSGNSNRLPLVAAGACFAKVRELQEKYAWRGPVLEVWLEARTDADYLETRALKLVIVIEALRTSVLRNEVRSTVLGQPEWEAFKGHILPLAENYFKSDLGIDKEAVKTIVSPDRWEQLNRKSFRWQIKAAFKKLGIEEAPRSIELFIASRNKLIHEGCFRCNSDLAAVPAEPDAPQDPQAEYLFIAGFVDRAIMQAVGLGSYVRKG